MRHLSNLSLQQTMEGDFVNSSWTAKLMLQLCKQ